LPKASHFAFVFKKDHQQKYRTFNFLNLPMMIDYKEIITIEPGKRGGKPCIRAMRITVNDILGRWYQE
jgi:hypothetical protein